jgi:hypothetical protein
LPFIDRDIRNSITELTTRLNALADSDDTTLDQLSEIVAYIKSNKDLISAITTDKVSVEDIVDNLTTNSTNKPLSAAQGMQLKKLVDNKVDKVEGKGLSSNDYTNTEKTKLAGIQEGAVSSWNDLEDRPFGEEVEHLGDTLTWDGTPTDVFVEYDRFTYYKVSENTPSYEELTDGTILVDNKGNDREITIHGSNHGNFIAIDNIAIVVYEDGAYYDGVVLPEKGIYFGFIPGIVTPKYMRLPHYVFVRTELKTLDKKYLPDGIGGINIKSAQVGQTIIVKAVDENGVPTEWEAVDLPEGIDIISADSVEQLPDPTTVPKGTIALVTSEVV